MIVSLLRESANYEFYKSKISRESFDKYLSIDPQKSIWTINSFLKIPENEREDFFNKNKKNIKENLLKWYDIIRTNKFLKSGQIKSKDLNVQLKGIEGNNNFKKLDNLISFLLEETPKLDIPLDRESYKIIFIDSKWLLVEVFTHEASVFFGRYNCRGSTCVSREDDDSYFKEHTDGYKLYYLRELPFSDKGYVLNPNFAGVGEYSDLQNIHSASNSDFPLYDLMFEKGDILRLPPKLIETLDGLVGEYNKLIFFLSELNDKDFAKFEKYVVNFINNLPSDKVPNARIIGAVELLKTKVSFDIFDSLLNQLSSEVRDILLTNVFLSNPEKNENLISLIPPENLYTSGTYFKYVAENKPNFKKKLKIINFFISKAKFNLATDILSISTLRIESFNTFLYELDKADDKDIFKYKDKDFSDFYKDFFVERQSSFQNYFITISKLPEYVGIPHKFSSGFDLGIFISEEYEIKDAKELDVLITYLYLRNMFLDEEKILSLLKNCNLSENSLNHKLGCILCVLLNKGKSLAHRIINEVLKLKNIKISSLDIINTVLRRDALLYGFFDLWKNNVIEKSKGMIRALLSGTSILYDPNDTSTSTLYLLLEDCLKTLLEYEEISSLEILDYLIEFLSYESIRVPKLREFIKKLLDSVDFNKEKRIALMFRVLTRFDFPVSLDKENKTFLIEGKVRVDFQDWFSLLCDTLFNKEISSLEDFASFIGFTIAYSDSKKENKLNYKKQLKESNSKLQYWGTCVDVDDNSDWSLNLLIDLDDKGERVSLQTFSKKVSIPKNIFDNIKDKDIEYILYASSNSLFGAIYDLDNDIHYLYR